MSWLLKEQLKQNKKIRVMKKIIYLFALALPFCLSSCNNEDSLTASDPMTLVEFPQGTNTYDNEFVQFYKDYGTQVLYKYTSTDFRWNITSDIPYYSEVADQNYIADAWALLKTNCFTIWPDDFLKKCLPYRILLASKIWSEKEQWGYDDKGNYVKSYVPVLHNAVYGLNHIAFGVTNSTLADMNNYQKKSLVGDVASALIGYATSRSKITIPADFVKLHDDFGKNNNGEDYGSWGYNGAGCLESYTLLDAYQDFGTFVKYLVTMSQAEFTGVFLNSNFDCGGTNYDSDWNIIPDHRVLQKYTVVINYFKNTLGIDLHAIGAKVSASFQ
jgi:hypothetical protein